MRTCPFSPALDTISSAISNLFNLDCVLNIGALTPRFLRTRTSLLPSTMMRIFLYFESRPWIISTSSRSSSCSLPHRRSSMDRVRYLSAFPRSESSLFFVNYYTRGDYGEIATFIVSPLLIISRALLISFNGILCEIKRSGSTSPAIMSSSACSTCLGLR